MGNKCTVKTETCGFQCTGYEGKEIWEERERVTKKISCETCRDHALKDESGYRDHVTVGLGGIPFNHANYMRYTDEVACVKAAYCERSGRC